MTSRRVVHSVACLDPETGGTAHVVPALVRALERAGEDVGLVTRRPRPGDPLPGLPSDVTFGRRGRWSGALDFGRALAREATGRGATLFHDHGIWLPSNHASARVARRLRRPRIVTPHGMLDRWALRWHGVRKRVAWRLYQRRDLEDAAMLHATSLSEARAFRDAGLSQPIAVVENGVVSPPAPPIRPATTPRVALFLSRLHPKKGLETLVDAWARVRPAGWQLWIAGPDEAGHEARVRAHVERAGISADVRFLGAVYGAERTAALGRAELFVLPTHAENFGLVVAEALAAALPVLTTTGAPWRALVDEGCGWWVDPSVAALAEGLGLATAAAPERLRAMGLLGHGLATRRFDWTAIGTRMRAVYDALLGDRSSPDVYPGAIPADDVRAP